MLEYLEEHRFDKKFDETGLKAFKQLQSAQDSVGDHFAKISKKADIKKIENLRMNPLLLCPNRWMNNCLYSGFWTSAAKEMN